MDTVNKFIKLVYKAKAEDTIAMTCLQASEIIEHIEEQDRAIAQANRAIDKEKARADDYLAQRLRKIDMWV